MRAKGNESVRPGSRRAGAAGISRRAFVTRALGGASALTLSGLGATATRAIAAPRLGSVDGSRLPSAQALRRQVREMVELGPRLPGTRPHRQFVDALADGFESAGLGVERDPHHFERWLAREFSLELLDGPDRGRIRTASYYTYSGRTPREGVAGELAYLGPIPIPSLSGNPLDLPTTQVGIERFIGQIGSGVSALVSGLPGGVRDKIVVMEAPIAPAPFGAVYPLLTYIHDPDGTLSPATDYKRAWTTLLTLPLLDALREAGAKGVVFSLDASPANARGQYTPFIWPYQDLPALIVDRDAGDRLRRAAERAPRARLTLRASLTERTRSDSLVAVLPGEPGNDEVMIVHTHTDGQNAFEENAGIASLALARYFSRRGRSSLKRTLVFSCVTGHFAAELPETEGFIEDHPDLVERAAAAITLEHLGASEWRDDSRGYYGTGESEPAVIFHSLTSIAGPGIESVQAVDLRRTLLLRPIGPAFFGVGAGLHGAGVPSLAYITGPNYLLALQGKRGHLDKFDARRMRRETAWAADVLQRLDEMPAELLRAGDTSVYGAPS